MSIQKRLRGLILMAGMMLAAFVAYADTVTVSTYYPSPFGSYQNLDSTSDTHLATVGGAVGIGTAVPAVGTKLDVVGTIQTSGSLYLGAANQRIGFAGTDVTLTTNNVERVRILNGGNVGIGTAAPGEKLEVAGNAKINGTVNMTIGGQSGIFQAACDGVNCYAVYAP